MSKALFEEYLGVVNRSIRENADRLPWRTVLSAARRLLDGRRIGVSIYKNQPAASHDFFTVHFVKDEFRILEHGKDDPDLTWPIRDAHLRTVTSDPDRYARNPLLLDLDWLQKYLGIGKMEPQEPEGV